MTKKQLIKSWTAELELLVQNGDLNAEDFVTNLWSKAELFYQDEQMKNHNFES